MKQLWKIVMKHEPIEHYLVGFDLNEAIKNVLKFVSNQTNTYTEDNIRTIEQLGYAFIKEDFK